jgi:hypothetical protein
MNNRCKPRDVGAGAQMACCSCAGKPTDCGATPTSTFRAWQMSGPDICTYLSWGSCSMNWELTWMRPGTPVDSILTRKRRESKTRAGASDGGRHDSGNQEMCKSKRCVTGQGDSVCATSCMATARNRRSGIWLLAMSNYPVWHCISKTLPLAVQAQSGAPNGGTSSASPAGCVHSVPCRSRK